MVGKVASHALYWSWLCLVLAVSMGSHLTPQLSVLFYKMGPSRNLLTRVVYSAGPCQCPDNSNSILALYTLAITSTVLSNGTISRLSPGSQRVLCQLGWHLLTRSPQALDGAVQLQVEGLGHCLSRAGRMQVRSSGSQDTVGAVLEVLGRKRGRPVTGGPSLLL